MSNQTKVTDRDKEVILRMAAGGTETQLIAERFGVSQHTIRAILRGHKKVNTQRYDPPPAKVEPPRESRENSTITLRGFTPESAAPYVQRYGSRVVVL